MLTYNDLLTRFKASGVYTVYEDKTVTARLTSSPILRLVIGYAKAGPFNRPVFIKKGDTETAERLFGKRDKALERKKSYFHKSLELALSEGDVLALNLWKLNTDVDSFNLPTMNADVAKYISLSMDPLDANGTPTTKLLASYYSKQKFWKLDKNYLLATRSAGNDRKRLLSFVNVSPNPATVFVVKSDVKGYNVTAKEWYKDTDVPKYMNPSDWMSDYFLDVIVINGNFGPEKWATLAQDPVFGAYFTKAGLIPSKLNEFISRKDISVRDTFSGCIIPDFVDLTGVSKYLEEIINSKTDITGILCAIDRKQIEDYETGDNTGYLDLVGHRLIDALTNECEFLSYNFRLSNDYVFNKNDAVSVLTLTNSGTTLAYSPKKIRVTITNANPLFATLTNVIKEGETLVKGEATTPGQNNGITLPAIMLEVVNITKTSTNIVFDLVSPLKNSETSTSGVFIDIMKDITTPETLAETNLITVGTPVVNTHFIYYVDKNDGSPKIKLIDYVFNAGDTATSVRDAIVADVNNNAANHGFTATSDSDPARFFFGAPVGSGATANGYTFSSELISGTSLFSTTGQLLVGGITAVFNYNMEPSNTFFMASPSSGAEANIAGINSDVYTKWKKGLIKDGDKVNDNGTTKYVKFTEIRDVEDIYSGDVQTADYRKLLKITYFSDEDLTQATTVAAFGDAIDSNGNNAGPDKLLFQNTGGSLKKIFEAEGISETTVRMDIAFEANVKLYDYLVGTDVNDVKILSRIKKITRNTVGSASAPNVIDVTCEDKVVLFTDGTGSPTTKVEHYKPFKQYTSSLSPFYLEGFVPKEASMPNGTEARLDSILDLIYNTPLASSLADPEMIDFRYIVDTFGNGLTPNSKFKLATLARRRQKCLGILNMPSMADFAESTNPRFTTSPTVTDPLPILKVDYIVDGGNTDENPNFLFTLPEEEQGASFVGFYGPNLVFKEGGQDVLIPPAALVSNNYVRKFNDGNPFKAVAGIRRGVLTATGLTGVEYQLNKEERGLFEEKGLNPIFQKKDGTIMIYGIESAYQKFQSSLNYIHARDTLISMEIDTEKLLEPYTFEDNDDALKAEVSTVLSTYYTNMRDSVGCIKSFELIFDDKNNPDFLAREGAALVDIKIELKDVVRKFIQRVTIFRSSPPVSGGFIAI